MRIDHAGHDGAARIVEDLGVRRDELFRRPTLKHPDDLALLHDEYGVVEGWGAGAIDQLVCSDERRHWGELHLGGPRIGGLGA
jgi:hypothetical protein